MLALFTFNISFITISANSDADELDYALGKALFDRPWTSAPSSTQATDGLGPLFNARSCLACHPRAGRGELRLKKDNTLTGNGYVLRLGSQSGQPDPTYGRQFQVNAIQGHQSEGDVLFDGVTFKIQKLNYGPLDPETRFSARLAQPLYGLGLLELISKEEILKKADPEDRNRDGISGRPNLIHGELGRFSWKATAPTLKAQAGAAFHNDIGMSNPLYPQHAGDCTDNQPDCLSGPHGNSIQFEDLEIDSQMLSMITVYLQGIKPPAPANTAGLELFLSTGCAQCHTPSYTLADGRTIQPFSDLLLHDMGQGLADGITEFEASGSEWRTQPLWGLSRADRYLHDGRARTLEEAILWHGGEATRAKENFINLENSYKTALIRFLKAL